MQGWGTSRLPFRLLSGHLLGQIEQPGSLTLRKFGECQQHFGLIVFFGEEVSQRDLQRLCKCRRCVHIRPIDLLLVAVDPDAAIGLVIRHKPTQRSLRQPAYGTGRLQALRKDGRDGLGQVRAMVAEPPTAWPIYL